MAETLKERNELDPRYMWDLSTLFENDAAWEAALLKVDGMIEKMASFAGTLSTAEQVLAYKEAAVETGRFVRNLYVFAHLRNSEDTREEDAKSMYGRISAKAVALMSASAYAEPELLSLPEETLRDLIADPCLAPYRFGLEQLLDRKPHTLSVSEETILATFGEAFAAPGRIADNLMDADMTFSPAVNNEGENVELTGANFILLQNSPDRQLRKSAFEQFYKEYKGHINTFAAAYNGAVKAACAEAAARHYGSSREMAMADEHLPMEIYDSLIAAVRKFMPAMHRYAALRKKILGVDELHYYDLYTPLVADSTKHYTYEEAQEMILDALSPLGAEYCGTVRKAFAERWIDVYPNKGKSNGAYSSGTYDSSPYILTNYTGTLDAVSTIAHEMGHSMQTWYSNHTQPPQYAHYALFVAEVASTVNENLLVEKLLAETEDPAERLSYLNQYMEGFKGTVYRQTMFAEFEKEAHAMAERGEALTPASLNAVYRKLVEDYFGPVLVMDEEVEYEWSRIPHFYYPFYVFRYATSYCAAAAISEAVRTEGEPAVKRYLEFLSMGGSAYPMDELAHAGVDLRTSEPIERALAKFEAIVAEAEALAE